ncbi:MAG: two-component system LytT family sensor kinase [Maribacter sp.]|jgi:two-component system LytT family sensor kinase
MFSYHVIENAIKHCSSADNEKGYLKINVKTEEQELNFIVKNSKPRLLLPTEVGGIGLVNVKRRLELVYPEQYQLSIDNVAKYYKVSLSIGLKENKI